MEWKTGGRRDRERRIERGGEGNDLVAKCGAEKFASGEM